MCVAYIVFKILTDPGKKQYIAVEELISVPRFIVNTLVFNEH